MNDDYITTKLDNAQCPDCGDRESVTETNATENAWPIPRAFRAHCDECGKTGDPLAFHHEFKWAEMTSEERKQAEEARARAEDRMAEYQHSAHYIASQREP